MLEIEIEHGQASETSNSYIDIDYVDMWTKRMIGFKKWTGGYDKDFMEEIPPLDEETKIEIVVGAANLLNNVTWIGDKINKCQYMSFPRNFTITIDKCFKTCYNSDLSEYNCCIPENIKKAQLLLVRDILEGSIDPTGRSYPAPVKNVFFPTGGSAVFAGAVFMAKNDYEGFRTINPNPLHSVKELIRPFRSNIKQGVALL